jgi:tRNA G18 (ribose-2'-O)-methylase SpoU
MNRGYFGIGVVNGKTPHNLGTLWRSANQLGAAFIFTVGKRYPAQHCDTLKTPRHIPLHEYEGQEDFRVPFDCQLVAVEMGGKPLAAFKHPERAVYLLGAEDHGLPKWALDRCVHRVSIPSVRTESFNVATAGAIVLYDRLVKEPPR